MKTLWLICCCLLALIQSSNAQSSRDHWDSLFHPKAVQHRREQQHQQWLNSWKDRACTGADVKQFWLMRLTQIVPDGMDSTYYAVLKQNAALVEALQSTVYDFEAQDIADQVNITRLREQGQLAEATVLEKLRLERIRVHQQQKFQAETLARQKAMQEQVAALRQEVEYLQILAQQAANAASAARAEAQSHH